LVLTQAWIFKKQNEGKNVRWNSDAGDDGDDDDDDDGGT
jgi:hypothetical protein